MGFGVCMAGQGQAEPSRDLCSFVLSSIQPESARGQPWQGEVGWGAASRRGWVPSPSGTGVWSRD